MNKDISGDFCFSFTLVDEGRIIIVSRFSQMTTLVGFRSVIYWRVKMTGFWDPDVLKYMKGYFE